MGAKKSVQDLRTREEREAAKRDFEVLMRQAAMEFDALDTQQDVDGEEGAGSDKQLDFLEFSRLVREREIAIHPEDHLHARFEFLDADGSGSIDVAEYMSYALQDAFERSAASLTDLFAAWDKDGNMQLDRDEFRDALRSYGFKADNEIIDRVFNDFVTSSLGTVSLTDLQFRLRVRNLARPRPLNQLRCLQWREGAEKASVVSRAHVKLDKLKPGSTIKDQIKHVLKAQVSRVMDLFRAWDTSGDGLISKHEFRAVVEALGFPVLSQTDFLMLPAEARKSGSDGVPRAAVDALFREVRASARACMGLARACATLRRAANPSTCIDHVHRFAEPAHTSSRTSGAPRSHPPCVSHTHAFPVPTPTRLPLTHTPASPTPTPTPLPPRSSTRTAAARWTTMR